ncbi:hypothetical protein L289_3445 [Acinetobacter gerneri DSM 14967 = CIP 107464 = MTCC 9824]|nr:hypothetical protein L289_3445 [Acinetobacter gerneri DSM 14967 = CIP 107464 = MTCC 9824]
MKFTADLNHLKLMWINNEDFENCPFYWAIFYLAEKVYLYS